MTQKLYTQAEVTKIVTARLEANSERLWVDKVNANMVEFTARLEESNHWKEEFTGEIRALKEAVAELVAGRTRWSAIQARAGWILFTAVVTALALVAIGFFFHIQLWNTAK